MPWTERQQRLLREMGLRVWSPPAGPAASTASTASSPADDRAARPDDRDADAHVDADLPPWLDDEPAVPAEPSAPPARRPAVPGRPVAAPSDDRAREIAAMDWPALREAVAGCTACGLCSTRRQTVFGTGHPEARWMVVGEAPGEQEDRQGEPFVGPAGQLLDAMLRALGLTRAADGDATPERRVFIANTLKCRPPGNRNPTPDELERCEPFLQRQLALVQPRIILAMGRFAVQSLLRSSEPIGKLRGRVHQYQGVPLIVTYHPAYLLRNLPDKARAWDDLCLAADVADGTFAPSS
ncbi:MAG: uracil-DNA glycosylase [Rubrivivax sp.]|jgi:DNA polymerase